MLFSIDEDQIDLFNAGKDKTGKRVEFLKARPTLVLDSKHFDGDFVDRLLGSFDDLDGMTDGVLIHGENWQALNMLQERYREQVKCIYIDPPYNTFATKIIYKNEYEHSTWLSLLEDRILLSLQLLNLLGLRVEKRRVYYDDDRRYLVYRGQTDQQRIVVIWRETQGWNKADLVHDKEFVAEQQLTDGADEVYVNGDSFIREAKALEPTFKRRMFAETRT